MFHARSLIVLAVSLAILSDQPDAAAEVAEAARLAASGSPFLIRHASDPVDWHPWGPEAFETARKEKKAIFVSIGYDSCHWCARMQAETFTDPAIAAILNRDFVNVIVDRVQRPDLNGVFMTYLNANRGAGGWPLNVWLTSEGIPFSVGTYFPASQPPSESEGTPTFTKVLSHVASQWSRFPDYIEKQSKRDFEQLRERLAAVDNPAERASEPSSAAALATAGYESLSATFDPVHGGFTSPAKFPQGATLRFLAFLASREPAESFRRRQSMKMLSVTAGALVQGGVFDHVGGGFHRYSIDPAWQIPRFEKMLPVQAENVASLLEIHDLSPAPRYADAIRRTLDFTTRDLLLPSGLFQSSLHSDSRISSDDPALQEGAYYVWSYDDFAAAVGAEDLAVLAEVFQVRRGGNLDPGASENAHLARSNVLRRATDEQELAARLGLTEADLAATIARGLEKLARSRARRSPPDLDTSTLTSWNADMASSFARAYQAFGDPAYLETARKCVETLLSTRFDKSTGHLAHAAGDAGGVFAYTYTATIRCLLDLYDATLDPGYVESAAMLQDRQIEFFWDEAQGGFFETVADSPDLRLRLKNVGADPEATTNDGASSNLLRLADCLDDPSYLGRCAALHRFALPRLRAQPTLSGELLVNALLLERVPVQLLVNAAPDSELAADIRRTAARHPNSRLTVFAFPPGGSDPGFVVKRNARLREAAATGATPSVSLGRAFRFAPPLASQKALESALSQP